MHIPDGFVSLPVNAAGYAAAVLACGVSAGRAKKTLGEQQIPMLGISAAFIFAAQMLNFPVAGGTSGHFLGAALAAIMLGPAGVCLVLTVVLTIQCLMFADGGVTALGTNIFNMGIIGGLGAYGIFRTSRLMLPKNRFGFLAATALSSWFSVVLAATFCSIELAISGTAPIRIVLPAMAGVHALIGIGEAIITVSVVSLAGSVRPDLVSGWDSRWAKLETVRV